MVNETKIIADRISTKFFTWMESTQTFVTEASDLPKFFDPRKQLWNDSIDTGFVLVSENTNNELLFTFTRNDTDNEGAVDGWIFTAAPRFNPMLSREMRLLIVND